MFFVLHANVCGKTVLHHGHSHGSSHEHSHSENCQNTNVHNNTSASDVDIITDENQEQVLQPKKSSKNINVRAAIIHVIGDFVQSVGVLCAAIIIKFKVQLIEMYASL